jgi:hypothetical protein
MMRKLDFDTLLWFAKLMPLGTPATYGPTYRVYLIDLSVIAKQAQNQNASLQKNRKPFPLEFANSTFSAERLAVYSNSFK